MFHLRIELRRKNVVASVSAFIVRLPRQFFYLELLLDLYIRRRCRCRSTARASRRRRRCVQSSRWLARHLRRISVKWRRVPTYRPPVTVGLHQRASLAGRRPGPTHSHRSSAGADVTSPPVRAAATARPAPSPLTLPLPRSLPDVVTSVSSLSNAAVA